MEPTDRKTKTTLKNLMIIGAILIIILIIVLVYFFVIKKNDSSKEETTSKITCGCYIIDPAIVNECGDPKRAFIFNLNTVSADQVCSAQCDINDIQDNLLNTTTTKDSFKTCTVKSISDTRCENMILKNQDDKIITGRVKPTDKINAEATFDKSTYVDYSFKVNSESSSPDKVDGNKITKEITPPNGVTSIEIIATAKDTQGEQINSIICRRVVDVETTGTTTVTGMTAVTEQQSDGKTKISQISISVGQLSSENVKIRFSFEPEFATLTAIDGITIEPTKGTIEMSKLDLYDSKNFSTDSFNILNDYIGGLKIIADVFVNDSNIGSASTTVTFSSTTPTETPTTEEQETLPDSQKSNFTATKTVGKSCIQKTDGTNSVTYTISVKNDKNTQDQISSIKDKLPLGFVYTINSSIINGTATNDSDIIGITTVGDTQEIVWEPSTPWSIESGKALTIVFQATAGPKSLIGQNLNEIIVNPVQIPLNPSTLRSQVNIIVAEDCTNITDEEKEIPKTGIFDSFIGRITLGIFIIIIGWLIYVRPEGALLSEKIITSKAYDDIQYRKHRITNPKRYFEEKILRKGSKENR